MEIEMNKVCPQCGARLFSDMDVCYECLYEFDKGEELADGKAVQKGAAPLDDGEEWTAEDVPVEAYPEESEGATEFATGNHWFFSMSSPSVDADIPIPASGLMIGRGQANDVVLHAKSVSRQHVHVEPDGDGLFVRDLGARNPSTINGNKAQGEVRMREGEKLSICGTTFVLKRNEEFTGYSTDATQLIV